MATSSAAQLVMRFPPVPKSADSALAAGSDQRCETYDVPAGRSTSGALFARLTDSGSPSPHALRGGASVCRTLPRSRGCAARAGGSGDAARPGRRQLPLLDAAVPHRRVRPRRARRARERALVAGSGRQPYVQAFFDSSSPTRRLFPAGRRGSGT